MEIWSMLQVLSQENEKKKKKTLLRMIAYVFVLWGKMCLFGGISGSKEGQTVAKPQDYKGSIYFIGSASKWNKKKFIRSPEYFLVPSMMSLLSLPHWSCSRFGLWVWPTQRSGLKVPPVTDLGSVWPFYASNLACKGKVHIWPVISYSGQLHPHSWLECLVETEVLKVEKGERSLQDQTGMCNKSYSLLKLCWLDCGFVSYLHYELVSFTATRTF